MWRWAAPVVLAFAVGAVVLDAGFVYDDPSALIENPVVHGDVPVFEAFSRDFWGRPASHGFITYRPLMPAVWALVWSAFPENPLPFHFLSALLHVLAVGMGMQLAYRLTPSVSAAVATGTVFALHPLNAETVGAIVAQADLLSFSLVLGACLRALRPASVRVGIECALVLLLASLVKESAIVFAPLVALLLFTSPSETPKRLLIVLPVALITAAVIAAQLSLPRAAGIRMITSNLAHEAEGGMRIWLGLYNVGRSLLKTVWPWPMVPNHGYAVVELQAGVLAPHAALGGVLLVVGIAAGVWAVRRRSRFWITALCFLYAPALLQSHWLVPLITDLAERLLYPATLGASMMAAAVVFHTFEKPMARAVVVASLGVFFAASSFAARRAWVSEDSLWTYAIHAEPRSALHQHNASNTFFRAGAIDQGAYHRLVYIYLLNRSPEPVQWDALEQARQMSATEGFVALPALLDSEDPCQLVRAFTVEAKRYEPLSRYVAEHWGGRYPRCLSVLKPN